ncbi:unnamed protein product (macronuclear) [Paramecium tetraurelia]|uniref:LsmAD domain-containing protein n=1 Tax=Paramecium tetraurelia TaxID=5888 RepID=A0BD44_PARTE|nr:uncharacterized protein GSPATT00004555001 [Paramecium tetraurelia]CAK56461.1 unnamed protein product [Paramecium tetraurelia]|eukprot:XP_001423859.1 hypothetical protein (macronuclear) [Paramecium tetraurelia strain d4-2]
MQANLAHFFLVLKSQECVQYQDINGAQYEGQIRLIQPHEQKLVFNYTRNLATNESNDNKLVQFKDLTYLKVQNQIPQSQIVEKSKSEKKTKTFVRWEQNVDASNLEDQAVKNFDQFEAIKKFGIEPTYDENKYTTKLIAPVTEDLRLYAEKCEKELKNDTSNKHVLEERNLKQLDDEEQAYSEVIREQPQQMAQVQQTIQTQLTSPPIQFFNSNKKKEKNNKILFIEKLLEPVNLISDDPEQQMKIKQINQEATTKFKFQQATTDNIPKLMLSNFINAIEGYKWQNMNPDPSKNKKEKLKK